MNINYKFSRRRDVRVESMSVTGRPPKRIFPENTTSVLFTIYISLNILLHANENGKEKPKIV